MPQSSTQYDGAMFINEWMQLQQFAFCKQWIVFLQTSNFDLELFTLGFS
jgi:hypothetical protein